MPRQPNRTSIPVSQQRTERATGTRRTRAQPAAHRCPTCGRRFVRSDWASVHRCKVSVCNGDRHTESTDDDGDRHDFPDPVGPPQQASHADGGAHPIVQSPGCRGRVAGAHVQFWDWHLRPGTEEAAFPRVVDMHLGPSATAAYNAMMLHVDTACAPVLRRVLADGAPTYPPLAQFEDDMTRWAECQWPPDAFLWRPASLCPLSPSGGVADDVCARTPHSCRYVRHPPAMAMRHRSRARPVRSAVGGHH